MFMRVNRNGNGAEFSECRTWRYALWRVWDEKRAFCMFVGLNPSTADETKDDPTVRRCIRYALEWGYGGLYMLNLFAYRATDPRVMKKAVDPVGPHNNFLLQQYSLSAGITVAAWGEHGKFLDRSAWGRKYLYNPYYLALTKSGEPRHPLYLKADLKPVPLEQEASHAPCTGEGAYAE